MTREENFLYQASGTWFRDSISFCKLGRKNYSLFAFSSSMKVQYVLNSSENINVVMTTATEITKSLLNAYNGLENSFCDVHQLKQSWKEQNFQIFFSIISFLVTGTKLIKTKMTSGIFEDCLVAEEQYLLLMTTAKSVFQILYCHVFNENHKNVFHVHDCSRNIQAHNFFQQSIDLYQIQRKKV